MNTHGEIGSPAHAGCSEDARRDKGRPAMTAGTVDRRSFALSACAGVVGALALVAAAPVAPAVARADETDDETTLAVTANATVRVEPDVAEVSLSVERTGDDAAKLSDELAAVVDDATRALREAGVPEASIEVSSLSITPTYDYHDGLLDTNAAPEITGYTGSVHVTLADIAVDQVGAAIAAANDAGVNGVDGVTYTCSTYDDAYDDALSQACARAAQKADAIARALGCARGRVRSVEEGYEDQSYKSVSASSDAYAMAETAASGDASATRAVPFSPAQLEIRASVSVTFDMTQA